MNESRPCENNVPQTPQRLDWPLKFYINVYEMVEGKTFGSEN